MIWNFRETKEFKQAINASLEVWELGKEEVLSKCRQEPLATARAILIVTVKKRSEMSFHSIGRAFKRDHGTIIHHLEAHDNRMLVDPGYNQNYKAIQDFIDNI